MIGPLGIRGGHVAPPEVHIGRHDDRLDAGTAATLAQSYVGESVVVKLAPCRINPNGNPAEVIRRRTFVVSMGASPVPVGHRAIGVWPVDEVLRRNCQGTGELFLVGRGICARCRASLAVEIVPDPGIFFVQHGLHHPVGLVDVRAGRRVVSSVVRVPVVRLQGTASIGEKEILAGILDIVAPGDHLVKGGLVAGGVIGLQADGVDQPAPVADIPAIVHIRNARGYGGISEIACSFIQEVQGALIDGASLIQFRGGELTRQTGLAESRLSQLVYQQQELVGVQRLGHADVEVQVPGSPVDKLQVPEVRQDVGIRPGPGTVKNVPRVVVKIVPAEHIVNPRQLG